LGHRQIKKGGDKMAKGKGEFDIPKPKPVPQGGSSTITPNTDNFPGSFSTEKGKKGKK
jgi:hypothetical protein